MAGGEKGDGEARVTVPPTMEVRRGVEGGGGPGRGHTGGRRDEDGVDGEEIARVRSASVCEAGL